MNCWVNAPRHPVRLGGTWLAFLLLTAVFAIASAPSAATLDPSVLPKVEAATFEVVQAKPEHDPLTYEKPLPLDLLPFQERTDKYYSIGTAFAIGKNRYVTAGHVLLAGAGSPWGPPELRDNKGHVFPIDKIEKFDLRRDFVVFSLTGQPGDAALAIEDKPSLNEVIYAVGDALGTGVVIRDGLYTSDTPEQQDGAWKWMRFSAAASPGNSGGPLLDKDGKVIGVVLAKSPNENLNYALPIAQVLDAPDHQAVMDELSSYQLDIFDSVQSDIFKAQFALPRSLQDFYGTYQKLFDAYNDKIIQALLGKESANLFPNGPGSQRLLYEQTIMNNVPSLIVRNSAGEWNRALPQYQTFPLDANGFVDAGALGRNGLFQLRRPDNIPPAKFYGDAALRMDLLAKTGMFQRQVGTEKIRITSLGKPIAESMHTDRWSRHWRVGTWVLPYADAYVVVYSLPVPDGSMMLMRLVPPGHAHDNGLDMDELSNFMYVTYGGTLAQWKDFLRDPSLQPDAFKDIRMDFDYGHGFSYASKQVAFSYTPDLQVIARNGLMWLGFHFVMENGKPVWDVGTVQIWKSDTSDNHDNLNVQRWSQPPSGLDNDLTGKWQQLSGRQHPYDGVARYEDDQMRIDAVLTPEAVVGKSQPALYTAFYGIEGNHPQGFMKAKLDLLMKNTQVFEH